MKRHEGEGPNPSGLCMCGCGERTPLAPTSRTRNGDVRGTPLRYCLFHNRRKSPVEYIVDAETGCWVWQRGRDSKGYGMTKRAGKATVAHRMVYERHVGRIPDGLQLDHLCRNRSCVNPAHLEPVTAAVNCQRGLKTKLTAEQVHEIRLHSESCEKVAAMYGVSDSTIHAIRSRQTWAETA